MATWTIRRARSTDAAALVSCIDDAYAIYAGKGLDLPAVSGGIADVIEHSIVYVAEKEGQIIGALVLALQDDHAQLQNVAVAPAATGLGLGRALMQQAELDAQRLGIATLSLSTHVDMPENVRLYKHLGWHETSRSGNKVYMQKTVKT